MPHKHSTDCPIPDDLCSAYKEQQRIIKLLQGIAIETKHGEIAVMELLSAIEALIKGENK
jgi:hypothetical protein